MAIMPAYRSGSLHAHHVSSPVLARAQIAISTGHEPCSDEAAMDLEPLVVRVKNEFLEMPGLCLTVPQAMRLWGLDFEDCQRVIEALIDVSFLQRTSHGKVVRTGG